MGYIFGGSTGETPESLKRKREVAEALLRRGATAMPQDLPQGLVAVAQALSGRIGLNALDKQEAAGRAKSDASFDDWYKANMPSREISGTSGVDALPAGEGGDYFANIRAAESGGNPNAKNPLSSATGLYQWTDSTWAEMMRKHPELGLTADGRGNPDQEEKAIRAFTAGNADVLKSAGIEPTGGNLYAAHFLGAGGARNVLSQPDDAPVASLVGPEVVKANPFLQGMSVGDFKRWSASKGGNDVLPGGEGEDMLADAWSKPDPNRPGHGIDTRTGTPSSFSEPDPERFGPTTAPKGDRLAQAFQAQPPLTPDGVTVPTMIGDEKPAPRPTPRPQQPAVDPVQTAAVQPAPAMQPRGIVSPRAEDNGYTRGPGAAPSNMSPQQAVAGALMRRQAAAGAPPVGNAPASPAGGIPGISPSTAAMLSDPNLSEGQRAVVLSVLKQQMDAQDPGNQLDLEKKRLEVDALRNPKPEYSVLTDEEEKAMGLDPAGSYQRGRDGKVDKIGGGGVNVTVGDNMKLTEGQSKDIGFYTRGIYANDELAGVDEELTSLGGNVAGKAGTLGNYAKSPEYQRAERSGREFLAVILRKDTGAAVTPDEFATYGPMYLPQPGDDPQTLADKRVARERALGAIKLGLGTATPLADEVDTKFAAERDARKKKPADKPTGPVRTNDGYTIEEIP
jgi:hypothetical protein